MILKKKTGKVSDMSYKLSKSKINDYLQCPRKFRYRYIDEIKVPQNIYFKIGSDVHQIAEDFINIWKRDNSIDILKTLLELEAPYEGDYKRHCIHMASFFTEKLVDEEYDVFSAEEYPIRTLCLSRVKKKAISPVDIGIMIPTPIPTIALKIRTT